MERFENIRDPDVKLSKTLAYLLRHAPGRDPQNFGDLVDSEGFALVNRLLKLPQFKNVNYGDIKRVVDNNDKKRFALAFRCEDDNEEDDINCVGAWYIRANNGHTFSVPNLELQPLSPDDVEFVAQKGIIVHCTYLRHWPSIREHGLSRMHRQHIHFLRCMPTVDRQKQVSGRLNADLFIFVDAKRAMADGMQFYVSVNNVILCPGDEAGFLSRKYFTKVQATNASGEVTELPVVDFV